MSLNQVLVFAIKYYNADARSHFTTAIIIQYDHNTWDQAWQDAFKEAAKYAENNNSYGCLLLGIECIGYPLEQDCA